MVPRRYTLLLSSETSVSPMMALTRVDLPPAVGPMTMVSFPRGTSNPATDMSGTRCTRGSASSSGAPPAAPFGGCCCCGCWYLGSRVGGAIESLAAPWVCSNTTVTSGMNTPRSFSSIARTFSSPRSSSSATSPSTGPATSRTMGSWSAVSRKALMRSTDTLSSMSFAAASGMIVRGTRSTLSTAKAGNTSSARMSLPSP
mmetsp:Transcript_17833/g.55344  ORF Transcript_17833/g.55344 Transcript_17833/m.55344 type:complete len:200 (+) Transcript_17833:38-637(+)